MQALLGLNNDKTRYTAARKLMVQSGRRFFRGKRKEARLRAPKRRGKDAGNLHGEMQCGEGA
jgi:hypothetical protein